MKLILGAFLVFLIGLAISSVASDEDNNDRSSFRTFILYYLLRPQTTVASNTAASPVTSAPSNINSNLTFQNNTNLSGITLTFTRKVRLAQLDSNAAPTEFIVPGRFSGMFRNMVEAFRQSITDESVIGRTTDPTDYADDVEE